MRTETEVLIEILRSRMEDMHPVERVELIDQLQKDYCPSCMTDEPLGSRCYCDVDI